MQIELTNEQYENLVKLVYLGNWMINAIRTNQSGDEYIEKYNTIEQHIFSFAKDFGLDKYIEFGREYNKFFPTQDFDESPEIEQYKRDYDDEIFWQELSDRLGNRDFWKKYGEKSILKMDQKERFLAEQEFIIKYEEEFEKHGIERLKIKKYGML